MQFKQVLPHIYIKIIKFNLSNYQMFSWPSGVVQGMVIKSMSPGLSCFVLFVFFPTGHYESDQYSFFVFVFVFVFFCVRQVLMFNFQKKNKPCRYKNDQAYCNIALRVIFHIHGLAQAFDFAAI